MAGLEPVPSVEPSLVDGSVSEPVEPTDETVDWSVGEAVVESVGEAAIVSVAEAGDEPVVEVSELEEESGLHWICPLDDSQQLSRLTLTMERSSPNVS